MARAAIGLFLVVLAAAGLVNTNAASTAGNPIEKVLSMMNDMMLNAVKEKAHEKEAFDKFKTWCHETTRDKGFDIDDGKKAIDQLTTDVEKHTSDAAVLAQEIAVLDQEIAEATEQLRKATNGRNWKRGEYEKTHADYMTGLESLTSAMNKVKKMIAATEGATAAMNKAMGDAGIEEAPAPTEDVDAAVVSLVQTLGERRELPEFARKALTSFLADDPNAADIGGTPEAASFESQSHDKLKNLENLHEMLKEEKNELEKRELRAQNAFNMLALDLENQIKNDKSSHATKSSAMKGSEVSAAQAKGDLEQATRVKNEDEKYVRDLIAMGHQKTSDFEARQKTRAEEIEAIDNAMEIISSGDVAGAGAKHLPAAMVQRKKGNGTSLAQLRRSSVRQPSGSQAAASYLAAQARKLGSNQLSLVAARAIADPFVKVRNIIEAMISKLQDEASDEANHKGWCDKELGTNEQTRNAKTTHIAELKASIEEMTAGNQRLATDIASLLKQVAELDASVAEATSNRDEEKAKNTQTITDARTAISAVQKATKVLKDFYTKAAGSTALMQFAGKGPADDAPETFDAPFKGNSGNDGQGGILSMIEVILSDFQRLFAETEEAEALAKHEYKVYMTESVADRESKEEDRVAKASRMSKMTHDIRMANKDLVFTQEELTAAMKYHDELKPTCVEAGVSYDDRVKAREEEIASLQKALSLLLDGTPE